MVQLCHEKGLKALVMDVADLSFTDASFDAVYSLNSLLHLPRTELPAVLREIRRVLTPGGLFFFGTYGGYDHAGIYDDDDHTPRRFFSFYEDTHLQRVVGQAFEILSFQSLQISENPQKLRFQSLLLQSPHT
jgi:ubiquinone/menaquinone biosynthesis C-methylase UbiE